MKKVWICSLATCVALVMSAGVFAQDFTYVVSGPGEFTGETGSEHAGDYVVNLNHDEAAAGPGAQGWSYGLELVGGTVTSATTDGTAVDAVFSGGFNKTSVIDPANNDGKQGAVSAVVLSFGGPEVLPNVADIMKVGASFTIGAEDSSASFAVVDGLIGMGQPVQIVVTESGLSADFTRESLTVALKLPPPPPPSCCDDAYNLGFSGASLRNETPGEGVADASETCSASGAVIEASGATTVYVNLISRAEIGAQGWSLSVEVTGELDVTNVTTDGTVGAPKPDGRFEGGFNKTSVADIEASGGRRGAVSAVVLCFGCPETLGAVSTESMFAITVDKLDPEAEEAEGSLAFTGEGEGLVGMGQPVDNVITVDGKSADVCNIDDAGVTIKIAPPAGTGPFQRGDPNNDGKVNIADPIWILNELFREGPANTCDAAADANDDQVLDVADAMYLIAYRFNGGDAPPAPFPDCDITEIEEGDLTCVEAAECAP